MGGASVVGMAEQNRPDAEGSDAEGSGDEDFRELLRRFLAGEGELDPAQLASAAGLPADPEQLARLMAQLQQALQNAGDSIDWSASTQQAAGIAARTSVPSTPAERAGLEQALQLAGLWLDEATTVGQLTAQPRLLSRSEWVTATMPVWTQLAAPVADSIGTALSTVLSDQELVGDAETPELVAGAGRLMRNVGGALFAMQLGQVVGQLSAEVVSGGDVGMPLLDGERIQAALVTQNVTEFGRDLDVPEQEVALYLAVRELAHARLFRHAKWLRLHVLSQVTEISRGVRIDTERLRELVERFDPAEPEELRTALTSGELIPPRSEEQTIALGRLETMLALIEGWVDVVTAEATALLPKAGAVAETVIRRRATGGPAEHAFGTLVGLELRPRRLREASAMWRAVQSAVGAAGRDALWDHPDLVPGSADLDDPSALVARLLGGPREADEVDRELEELLGQDGARDGEAPGGD